MKDVSASATTTIRRLISLRIKMPRLAIGASLGAMFDAIHEFYRLAYVDPYAGPRGHPQATSGDYLGVRDPVR